METPGLMLKREREARGMTLTELSKVTRIPESSLEAIENNAFESIPAEVFVRGFLRNYARQLSIPTEDIMQAYEAWQRQNRVIASDTQDERKQSDMTGYAADEMDADNDNHENIAQHSFRFAYVAIILIAVASLGLSFLFMGTGEAEESDADYNVQPGETVESPFLISNTSEGWLAE